MTEQEAIRVAIEHIKERNMSATHLDMAIKALEKQIAKKPTDANYDRFDCFGRCPICNYGVVSQFSTPYNYCPKCGQRIDWSEENDRD